MNGFPRPFLRDFVSACFLLSFSAIQALLYPAGVESLVIMNSACCRLQGCAVWFALSSLSFLLSVAIYAGVLNSASDKTPGVFGPGFVLACISTHALITGSAC